MSSVMLDPGIGYVVVSGFALLFAHAALAKWRSIGEFRAVLENYRLFPRPLVGALAVVVPALEAGIALALLAAVSRPVAAVAGAALLLAYAAAIGVNLRRGRYDLDCGCSGPGNRRPIAPWMLGRNVLFAAALAALVPPWASRALGWIDVVTVVGGLAVLVLLYAAADRLLGQVMPRTASLRGAR